MQVKSCQPYDISHLKVAKVRATSFVSQKSVILLDHYYERGGSRHRSVQVPEAFPTSKYGDLRPFSYTPLAKPRSIRLLSFNILESGQIIGTLDTIDFDIRRKYDALSYTWQYSYPASGTYGALDGSDRHTARDCSIEIDGCTLSITSNLRDALLALIEHESTSDLWVDSICTNQADNAERSAQVNFMDEIYSEADQVIVWLGADDAETEISIYMISMFSSISKRILAEPKDNWDYFDFSL